MGVVGGLFQNTPISLWVLKIPFFKKLKNVNANKLIHTGTTLKIFEIFPRLMREFGFHSVSLIIGILQSLISSAFALCTSKGVTPFLP
ncbi:hypothetical protein VN1205_05380 [Helicobacter pylori]|nr:hypothetical protein VN1205_05380 [Helicobacter pylori]